MLRVGDRLYDLVLAQSGFHVALTEGHTKQIRQDWRLDAHYIPQPTQPAREDAGWEYLRLTIFALAYSVADWRDLCGLGLDPLHEGEESVWLGTSGLENLLARWSEREERDLIPGDLTVKRTGGYLFACALEGAIRYEDGREEELLLQDEIPFASVSLRVPINAPDPIKTARAIAAREIQFTDCASAHITRHDWRRQETPDALLDNAHHVILETPWREINNAR